MKPNNKIYPQIEKKIEVLKSMSILLVNINKLSHTQMAQKVKIKKTVLNPIFLMLNK